MFGQDDIGWPSQAPDREVSGRYKVAQKNNYSGPPHTGGGKVQERIIEPPQYRGGGVQTGKKQNDNKI